ncbi:hypothetical protein MJO28_006797 [Puccinia striiformis f. sp. tritici]|uniref:Uncharacterized protein n=1 Tax=Puccinia striiformis f. sp. tritici TaxID=168172 RepID=A0ACC0EIH4_9BASI|nr:hypothetical protein MJO28_006797 [Puccinia striiformis f. sp. tritici]
MAKIAQSYEPSVTYLPFPRKPTQPFREAIRSNRRLFSRRISEQHLFEQVLNSSLHCDHYLLPELDRFRYPATKFPV